jgi:hypothetical protein
MLDLFKERVESVEDEVLALRRLPERMGRMDETLQAVVHTQQEMKAADLRADEREERRVIALRNDMHEGFKALEKRFDEHDKDHAAVLAGMYGATPPRRGVDWKMILLVVSGVSVPIASAIIATGGFG